MADREPVTPQEFVADLLPADTSLSAGSVVCVGVFDGVHRGHQAVVRQARAVADALAAQDVAAGGIATRIPVVAVTFDPHPRSVLRADEPSPSLCAVSTRVRLLRDAGCDAVLLITFTTAVAAMSATAFVQQCLVDTLRARAVVVGADFRFGARAAGDVALLTDLGTRSGFAVHPVASVGRAGQRWSSSGLRGLLARGDVAEAAEILGRWYAVEGTVVEGERRGRELGYPTANIDVDPGRALPADGVYAGWLSVDERRMPAAISVGTNPQFAGQTRTVEAYAIDEQGLDLYGRHAECEFVARIRGQQVFDDLAGLRHQMADDVAVSRRILVEA